MYNNRGGGFWDSFPAVTKNIIIINLLVWLGSVTLPSILAQKFGIRFDPTDMLGLHYVGSEKFNLAQFFTYMFMHDTSSIGHVFFNMFSVFMFGRTLELVMGRKIFLLYYLLTGVGAAIVQQIVWAYMGVGGSMYVDYFVTVGASGSVFGILLAFGMLFPQTPLYLMFIPVPIKAKYFVIFYGLFELFMGVRGTGDGIAHWAHLGGMIFGYLFIMQWKKRVRNNGSNRF
ncbi:MAG: rhomboid family intramembrane serine protease [Bacteroidales bacterium]